jgi:hypothetical protein
MKMIQQNWQHYRDLYGIQNKTYRNDYALSVALGIVGGHTWQVDSIPANMATVLPQHELTSTGLDNYLVQYQDSQGKKRKIFWRNMDFHAMGKQHLENIVATH